MFGAALETLHDVGRGLGAQSAGSPGPVGLSEVAGVSGHGAVGHVVDHVVGILDEDLTGKSERALVALLSDSKVVHVLGTPTPLNATVVLGVVEGSHLKKILACLH